jgi:nicotinate-nucleotide adenylyltransferase
VSERLGILGGTFDPVHRGHLASAIEVKAALNLDRLLFVVSARPPHKGERAAASPQQRLEMVRRSLCDQIGLEADGTEVDRNAPSWTVDTLTELGKRLPSAQLWFIVGIDAWADVNTWHRPEALLELANIVVTNRPGSDFGPNEPKPPFAALASACYDPATDAHLHDSGHVLTGHRIQGIQVSSSQVRQRVARNEPFDQLVVPAVADYIAEHRLYLGTP